MTGPQTLRAGKLGLVTFLLDFSLPVIAQAQATIQGAVQVYSGAGADGPASLVSNAVPFKPGVVTSAANVRVLLGGTEVSVASRVLATWPSDGSVRALLLQFDAPAAANYIIEVGAPRTTVDRTFVAVTWDLPTRILTLSSSHLSAPLIFGEQKPLGQTGFPLWDQKQLSAYRLHRTGGTAACANANRYYDSITTTYQLYARTGDLKYLTNARRWALHLSARPDLSLRPEHRPRPV